MVHSFCQFLHVVTVLLYVSVLLRTRMCQLSETFRDVHRGNTWVDPVTVVTVAVVYLFSCLVTRICNSAVV